MAPWKRQRGRATCEAGLLSAFAKPPGPRPKPGCQGLCKCGVSPLRSVVSSRNPRVPCGIRPADAGWFLAGLFTVHRFGRSWASENGLERRRVGGKVGFRRLARFRSLAATIRATASASCRRWGVVLRIACGAAPLGGPQIRLGDCRHIPIVTAQQVEAVYRSVSDICINYGVGRIT